MYVNIYYLRMRELYKRFVKTWIRFANPWIRFDLICQFSKDLIRRFVSSYGVQKIHFVDSFRDAIFKRFDESSKSLVLQDRQIRICESSGFQKDSFCGFVLFNGVQKIRFVDSLCDAIFKRFVLWIRFVRPKISKYSIRFGRIRVQFPHP